VDKEIKRRAKVLYGAKKYALMVIGGKAFVEKVLNDNSDIFTVKRRARGAKEMKFGVWGGLCAARELRVRVVKALEKPIVKAIRS